MLVPLLSPSRPPLPTCQMLLFVANALFGNVSGCAPCKMVVQCSMSVLTCPLGTVPSLPPLSSGVFLYVCAACGYAIYVSHFRPLILFRFFFVIKYNGPWSLILLSFFPSLHPSLSFFFKTHSCLPSSLSFLTIPSLIH